MQSLPRQDRLVTFAPTAQQSELWPRQPVDVRADQRDRERFCVPCHSDGLPMSFILQPWQLFFMVLASWVHHEQQKIIEFYQAELKAVMDAQGEETTAADR